MLLAILLKATVFFIGLSLFDANFILNICVILDEILMMSSILINKNKLPAE